MSENFFESMTKVSEVKCNLVVSYFDRYAHILTNGAFDKVSYVDLFCGPGIYDDGSESTPIQITKKVVRSELLCGNVELVFNDSNVCYVDSLRNYVSKIEGIERLRHTPKFFNQDGMRESNHFWSNQSTSSFVFIDPWGYKSIDCDLIKKAIMPHGSECIFYFNFNRINAAIDHPKNYSLLDNIWEPHEVQQLKREVEGMGVKTREEYVVKSLYDKFKNQATLVLPFCFKSQSQNRTSHYLFFITKSFLGFDVMKTLMRSVSNMVSEWKEDYSNWVFGLGFDAGGYAGHVQTSLLGVDPIRWLAHELHEKYKNREPLTDNPVYGTAFNSIFEGHSKDNMFTKEEYIKALELLERTGKLTVRAPGKRGKYPKGSVLKFK